ncbi:Uncharacterised protein [Mycoplasmopsis citelli]|uniref:Lipoprotein n=1 Tax=Mycoplasmopsis citelli TaxID=171281 RepID=A0A449B1V2_9BACT|nr:hypothetical protein [Mycoplasmopsis citelli]VEU74578.1 Uncharacterised protein [Mycoplasmopsis citelli]
MKRNNFWKSLLLLASPIAITVASISCAKSQIKEDPGKPEVTEPPTPMNPPKGDDKDPINPEGSQTNPPVTGEKPNPEGETNPPATSGETTTKKEDTTPEGSITPPTENPQKTEETIIETPPTDQGDGNSSKQEETEQQPKVDPQKSAKEEYVKKLKEQLKELLFYKSGNTKTQYDTDLTKYTTPDAKFVSESTPLETKIKFKLNAWNLKYLYAQVAELEDKFKDSVFYEDFLKYIKELQDKGNNIFISSTENTPSIDSDKLNEVVYKLNAQAAVNNRNGQTQSSQSKK